MGNKSSSPLPSFQTARSGLDDSELMHIKLIFSRISRGGSGIGIAAFVELTSGAAHCASTEAGALSSPSSINHAITKSSSSNSRIGLPGVLEKLFSVVDTKKDGVIDYEEYVSVVALFRIGSVEDKIKLLFCMYESQKSNGYMLAASLKQLIVDALIVSSSKEPGQAELRGRAVDLEPLAECMAEMALHQYAATTGKIGFEEFAAFVKVEGSLQALLQLLPEVVDG